MEYGKVEMKLIEEALLVDQENSVRELTDLQLAAVGGGCGDVVFH